MTVLVFALPDKVGQPFEFGPRQTGKEPRYHIAWVGPCIILLVSNCSFWTTYRMALGNWPI